MADSISDGADRRLAGSNEHVASTTNDSATISSREPLPCHSRTSSLGNWNDGLFDALDGFPSVSQSLNNQGNSITADDIISAHECLGGQGRTSPMRCGGAVRGSRRRSLTPQKTGVRGVAVRLGSVERTRVGGSGSVGEEHVLRSVQMDSAPRTSYEGILKKLEFMSGGYTAENVDRTRLLLSRLKETLEARRTPVLPRTAMEASGARGYQKTPVRNELQETATKKLMFTMTSSGEGQVGGGTEGPTTLPSLARYRGAARRVTFGRVSMDEEREQAIVEDDGAEKGAEFSFQTMSCMAGSTPYGGKACGERRGRVAGWVDREMADESTDCGMINKNQLASALKKSLTFAGHDERGAANEVHVSDAAGEQAEEAENPEKAAVDAGIAQRFSFGSERLHFHGGAGGHCPQRDGEATTPDFVTFRTTSRRLLTPPSLSPSLLEFHGRAKRVSGALGPHGEADDGDHDENTPVGADVRNAKASKFSLPRLDVTETKQNNNKSDKYLALSPTEQGIRDSLKLERTKRLSSASKFNSASTPGH